MNKYKKLMIIILLLFTISIGGKTNHVWSISNTNKMDISQKWSYFLQSGEEKIITQYSDQINECVYVSVLNNNWSESLVAIDKLGVKKWVFREPKLRNIEVLKVEEDYIYVNAIKASNLYHNGFDGENRKLYRLNANGEIDWEYTYNDKTKYSYQVLDIIVSKEQDIILMSLFEIKKVDIFNNEKWSLKMSDGEREDNNANPKNRFTGIIFDDSENLIVSEKQGLIHTFDYEGKLINSVDYSNVIDDENYRIVGVFKDGTRCILTENWYNRIYSFTENGDLNWSSVLGNSRYKLQLENDIFYILSSFGDFSYYGFNKVNTYSTEGELYFTYFTGINNSGIAVDKNNFVFNLNKDSSTKKWKIECYDPKGYIKNKFILPYETDYKIGSFIGDGVLILFNERRVYGLSANTEEFPIKKEVESVSLNKTELKLVEGATENLMATVIPEGATNKNVTWSSINPSVAIVSDTGLVTAISEGETTITVTTEEGGFKATCEVVVKKDTEWKIWEPKYNVDPDKVWTVEFNKILDIDTINERKIYITDQHDKIIPVSYSQNKQGPDKFIYLTPINDYQSGKVYTLWIQDLIADDGSIISKNIKMEFTIK